MIQLIGDGGETAKPQLSLLPAPRSRWLNRTVVGIGLASLCSDVGHEMATTAMPAEAA